MSNAPNAIQSVGGDDDAAERNATRYRACAGAGDRDLSFRLTRLDKYSRYVFSRFRKDHTGRVPAFQIAGVGKVILNFVWLSLGQHHLKHGGHETNHRGHREENSQPQKGTRSTKKLLTAISRSVF